MQSKLNLREECLRNFRISTTILKKGAEAGLTIKEIGKIIYRDDSDEESTVERLIAEAKHYAAICVNGGNSDIIKNKIKNDIARSQLKRHVGCDMPVISENIILE